MHVSGWQRAVKSTVPVCASRDPALCSLVSALSTSGDSDANVAVRRRWSACIQCEARTGIEQWHIATRSTSSNRTDSSNTTTGPGNCSIRAVPSRQKATGVWHCCPCHGCALLAPGGIGRMTPGKVRIVSFFFDSTYLYY